MPEGTLVTEEENIAVKKSFTEEDVKDAALKLAGKLSAASAMSMNRRERRQLSKVNNGMKIIGSNKPFVAEKTKLKRGVLNVE